MSRILVVDDENGIRVTMREMLQAEGYTVDIAADADEALATLDANGADVVVCDIMLPGTSGLALLKALRQAAPDSAVIMMTGDPAIDTAAEAMRHGAMDYLVKPASRGAILRSVGNAVRHKALDDERRRLEEENRRHREELESLVRERTHELEEALETVRRTQNEVIKQERLSALGRMVSGIAHDFNNVLMPIMSLPDYLLSDPARLADRDEVTSALESILDAARQAREIVRRLREFYRPDEAMALQPVCIQDLVRHVIALTEPAWKSQQQAAGRTVSIHTDFPEPPIVVQANESGLREVITNLLLNAMDAVESEGNVELTATSNDDTVSLRIRDNGAGMSEETCQRCFEPFYSTKGEHGTGLGLAVCYGIVQRHGGRITVDSHLGRGTEFTIELPLKRAGEARKSAREETEPETAAHSLRILVVDDEALSRSILTRYLSRANHTVTTADNGTEALTRLGEAPFDLVITDRAMPGMNGDDLALAARQQWPDLRIVMLTGFGDLMQYQSEQPAGIDAVIGKPVTADELIHTVDAVMRAPAAGDGKNL